jgi:signal transduction histidine kinase
VRDPGRLRWTAASPSKRRGDDHPTIQGSPARLRELMTNLIFNAVDALPTGGTIRLRVAQENGQGIVQVVDSSIGMSAELLAPVFEPFFTTKGWGGTRLGLAMMFGIVEQHCGHIDVDSVPGQGTTYGIFCHRASSGWGGPVPTVADSASASVASYQRTPQDRTAAEMARLLAPRSNYPGA